MRKITKVELFLFATALLFAACTTEENNINEQQEDVESEESTTVDKKLFVYQLDREPWSYDNPLTEDSKFTVTHDEQRLGFFGWSLDSDAQIYMTFPESTEEYNKAILTYKMGGWNEGPADYDMTTQIMVFDKATEEYYEIARAITPYGGSFDSDWSKLFYLDVTEYLPILTGECEFRVFYCGFDSTSTNSHTVTMTFDFYSTESVEPRTLYYTKIYDSRENQNGYRGWYYGSDSLPIEDDIKLGVREFTVPEDVASLLMKVNITGHGEEQGLFPDRENYSTKNAAEFDENTYELVINGESYGYGDIYYDNSETYFQAGTYRYDRANWGPGLPVNTQYWAIDNIPTSREMSIDFNLENYISPNDTPKAYYIIQVDVFGLSM